MLLHSEPWSGLYAKSNAGPTNGTNAPHRPKTTTSNPLAAPRLRGMRILSALHRLIRNDP